MQPSSEGSQIELAGVLAKQITSNGFAVIKDFVRPSDLKEAQAFVSRAVERNGGEYAAFTGTDDLKGLFLENLPNDPAFVDLCRQIYECETKQVAPEASFYQILRCLSGSGAKAHSMRFHFDSYVLTALIPILIPDHGSPGRLIILPNTRRIRRTYLANVIDKLLFDNKVSQKLLHIAYRLGTKKMIRLDLKPGDLYFFWGYKSLHTNEPCEADTIRATALLHYADPHAQSRLKQRWRSH
jgi:hypothetical protein